jgi:hypothetical protein
MSFRTWMTFAVMAIVLTVSAASAQTPAAGAPLTLTATPANVSEAGDRVKINILKWSTPEEQSALASSVVPPPKPAAPAAGTAAAAAAPAAPAAPAPPFDPMKSLLTALDSAGTVGMLWTSENTGYSLKYASRTTLPDGSERIVLATNRRIDSLSSRPAVSTDPQFTILELRLDSRGTGEAKTSLTERVVLDIGSNTIGLSDYSGAPAALKNVKK